MNGLNISISALITEQTMQDAKKKKFTFRVDRHVGKKLIKQVIEKKFKVNVVSIATARVKGKTARSGKKRIEMLKPVFKKAVVKLLPDQSISLFEQAAK